jgi:CBS domain-containing protein
MMLINKVYTRDVVTVTPDTSVATVATCMADHKIGVLVVVDDKKPVGIVTDRDLVVRVLANRLPPEQTLVREVMTPKPIRAPEDGTLEGALEQMRFYRIRRLVVVDAAQALVGILSLDDVFALLHEEQLALHTVTDVLRAIHHEAMP